VIVSKLLIVVPRGRGFCGRAVLVADDGTTRAGPFRALGSASVRVARKHDNADASPLFPFGHPPTGGYIVAASLPPGYVHAKRTRRYGRVGGLLLAPKSGQALDAMANGRKLIAIHGGPRDKKKRLRRTRGGVRLSNTHMTALLVAINEAQRDDDPLTVVEIVEAELSRKRKKRSGQSGYVPMLLLPFALGGSKTSVARRDVLRAAAIVAGAIAIQACDRPSDCSPLSCFPDDDAGDADANTDANADGDEGGPPDGGECGYECVGGVG
jgi:hypothetical protein